MVHFYKRQIHWETVRFWVVGYDNRYVSVCLPVCLSLSMDECVSLSVCLCLYVCESMGVSVSVYVSINS